MTSEKWLHVATTTGNHRVKSVQFSSVTENST